MKKIFKLFICALFIIILSGCGKINKITYTKFNEYFTNKDGYNIINNTDKFDIDVRKYIEAGNGDVQVFFIEFANKKYANDYVKSVYKTDKNYKVKYAAGCTYIKRTKNKYEKAYKIDNTLLIASTVNKKYKRDVNKILKDLGY